eukprot:TRINITY_DN24926_c0_g3_i1.p1 TRINITY_DN24926_c0_g3~~TRINITY_DN24926_c0_g3_i1.p1  ORF type:complete len:612 (-),score=109.98 TRINITY_DN24926_c0_g3_i1:102-1937(-)
MALNGTERGQPGTRRTASKPRDREREREREQQHRERDRSSREREPPIVKVQSPGGRERSTSRKPAGPTSHGRMLRVEYRGQPYDWFSLDEMGDITRSADFATTLRENVAHYFGVPPEYQMLFDDEGVLATTVDVIRTLQSVKPHLQVYDARELPVRMQEDAAQRLACAAAEMSRTQQLLYGSGAANGVSPAVAAVMMSPETADTIPMGAAIARPAPQPRVVAVEPAAVSVATVTPATMAAAPVEPVAAPATLAAASPDPPYAARMEGQIRAELFRGNSPEAQAHVAPAAVPAAVAQPSRLWQTSRRATGQFGAAPPGATDGAAAAAPAAAAAATAFDQLDRNHDGVITREEFQRALQSGVAEVVPPAPREPIQGNQNIASAVSQEMMSLAEQLQYQQQQLAQLYSTGLLSGGAGSAPAVSAAAPPVRTEPIAAMGAGSNSLMPGVRPGVPPSWQGAELPGAGARGVSGPNITDVPLGGVAAAGQGWPMGFSQQQQQPTGGVAARMTTPRQQVEPGSFEVILRKDPSAGERGMRFGFANVPTADGRALLISWIDPHGLLGAWCQNYPEQAAREGDRILAVNGVKGDVEAMRTQLQTEAIHMFIQGSDQRPFP